MDIKEINGKEMELATARVVLANLKNELKTKEAQFQVMSKEYWKEVGVSNAEGRKAYITIELVEEMNEVIEAQNNVILLEAELRCLERLYEAEQGGE